MNIDLTNRHTKKVIFSHDEEGNTIALTVSAALEAKTNLRDVDLSGAYLTGVDLTGVDLTEAKLTGAKFTGVDLTDTYLTGADLTDSKLIRG